MMEKLPPGKLNVIIHTLFIVTVIILSCKSNIQDKKHGFKSSDSISDVRTEDTNKLQVNAIEEQEGYLKDDYIRMIEAHFDSIKSGKLRRGNGHIYDQKDNMYDYGYNKTYDDSGSLVTSYFYYTNYERSNHYSYCDYYINKKIVLKVSKLSFYLTYNPVSDNRYNSEIGYYLAGYINKELQDNFNLEVVIKAYYKNGTLYKTFTRLPGSDTFIDQKFPLKDSSYVSVARYVYLNNNDILNFYFLSGTDSTLSTGLKLSENLKYLFTVGGQLVSIPESVQNLENLEFLDLSRNRFKLYHHRSLSLKVLDLSHNQLSDFYCDIEGGSLKYLILNNNAISELDTSIRKLIKLKTLILSWNQLSSLPDKISHLDSLKYLVLDHNKFTEFPVEACKAKNVYLSYNQITELPDSIHECTNIVNLSLKHNGLKRIGPSIRNFKNLRILDLSDNQLTELPEEISELGSLRDLYLNGNQLTSLPKSIMKLQRLERLILPSSYMEKDEFKRLKSALKNTEIR